MPTNSEIDNKNTCVFGFKIRFRHFFLVSTGYLLLYLTFFAPVFLSNKLLAYGDGISFFVPAYYSSDSAWTNMIFAGYPTIGDPQYMNWYPPALILKLVPHSWNAFVLLAYILAASFTYLYVHTLTRSALAASISGVIYSMSGFMIGHLSMIVMVHAAAWLPLAICAFEKLSYRLTKQWFAIAVFAVSCCILSGSPQITTYSLGLSLIYGVFRGYKSNAGRWRYYRWVVAVFSISVGISCIQIIPTLELRALSLRTEWTYENFISGSLPLWQSLQYIYPFLFGGGGVAAPPFNLMPYWGGTGNFLDVASYVGLLPLMLALIGIAKYRERGLSFFWFWVTMASLAFSFGNNLLIGGLLYYIPVYNLFQAPFRHSITVAFSISILAGLGVVSMQKRKIPKRILRRILIGSTSLVLLSLFLLIFFQDMLTKQASEAGAEGLSFLPWNNPALVVPILIFSISVIALWAVDYWRHCKGVSLILLVAIIVDLLSFSYWSLNWNVIPVSQEKIKLAPTMEAYRDTLRSSHQRLLVSQGIVDHWQPNGIFPNLTNLWNIPNSGGYSPLILARISKMMALDVIGSLGRVPLVSNEHQLDLTSTKYLLTPAFETAIHEGLGWSNRNLDLSFGEGVCFSNTKDSEIILNMPDTFFVANSIGIVSSASCSADVTNDSELVQIEVSTIQGNAEVHHLLSGRDTSDYAYDCPDIQPRVKHQKAQVFQSGITISPEGYNCQVHEYSAQIHLNQPQRISSLRFSWVGPSARLNINKISLINSQESISLPLSPLDISAKWEKVDQLEDNFVYRNRDVLPRTWLVPETVVLTADEILRVVHSSSLPDGRTYDPTSIALVEAESARFNSTSVQPTDSAKVSDIGDDFLEVRTQTSDDQFLVLSDVYYPGWHAKIDGKSTHIYQTNYLLRGVKVPPGKHTIRFEFSPLSFKLGMGISAASFSVFIYFLKKDLRVST